jgi:TPR repeat protein
VSKPLFLLVLLTLVLAGAQQSVNDHSSAASRGDKAALRQLMIRAERGDPNAEYYLGLMYEAGEGVDKDAMQAARWYRRSADQNFAAAQYNLGYLYDRGKDYAQAAQWYRRAADQGHAFSQLYLGIMYRRGEGVPKDNVQAALWLRRAADQRLSGAQYYLGLMYEEGEGVAKDEIQAAKWYRLAAEQGLAAAQNALGWMNAEGKGVPRDLVAAYMWLNLAATQGDETAKRNRDIVGKQMTAEQIAEAQRRSRQWTPSP